MQFTCAPFRTKYTSQYIYIYIPLNEIIPQIFNFIYRSGDNRVDKSRRQRLKLPPFPSFVFFLLRPLAEKRRRNEESNYARQRLGLSIDINSVEN